ncbi:MAG: 23S rRNA (uracil(1939)-C(5))-methyltransferase RlmD [Oscillospiraceae bacterium]|nr:23S rRNA (uracil(1939)-C(5))-methyltransferase RlmD [Oscillospiraceae bacterium]
MERNDRCPLYKKCGGCQLQNLSYEEQLSYKQVKVIRLLGQFTHVDEIIGMKNPTHYRNKVQAAFGTDRRGNVISGVYQSSTHKIVPVEKCMIEDEKADEIIGTIRKLMPSFKMKSYDENRGTGLIRHVLIKRGFKSGQIMVVIVTAKPMFPSRRAFVNPLLQRHPEITTVIHNVNDGFTSLVLGKHSEVVYGDGKIEEQLLGCTFRISPSAFYQINPAQTEVLYSKAMEFAELSGKETVIDAYCGTGTIGIIAAKTAGNVIGVELNKDAVRDARENARLNNIENIRFIAADAGEFMVDMAMAGNKADVVIMDPPRAGSDKKFLTSVMTLAPKRIVYVSCNPETLARDLKTLTARGKYIVKKIQPVDMFPHTNHVECVVQLIKA